jgi:hypothetical protein
VTASISLSILAKRPLIHLEETWIIEPGVAAEDEAALRGTEEASLSASSLS